MLNKTSNVKILSPIVLALDCATRGCSVCVYQDGQVLAVKRLEMSRGQAEVLIPLVQDVLAEAGLTTKDLTMIAVTHGPGAFTGLRIGLSAARGLSLALKIPCVGVTTLEVLAHGTRPLERSGQKIVACVESKRADIYVQVFDDDLQAKTEPLAVDGSALRALFDQNDNLMLVGDAALRAFEMLDGTGLALKLSEGDPLPDPALLARLGADRMEGATTPKPLYLRPPDAKLPKAQGRSRI